MDSEKTLQTLTEQLSQNDLACERLEYCGEVTGGIINKAGMYKCSDGKKYFVKYNTNPCALSMFQTERKSLDILRKTHIFRVPSSFLVFDDKKTGGTFHVLEYIENLQPLSRWTQFGEQVARLHSMNSTILKSKEKHASNICDQTAGSSTSKPVDKFGFHMETYLGTFTPGVVWRDTWQEYFIRDILEPLFKWAESKYGDREISEKWTELSPIIHKAFEGEDILPELLHGDLCPINFGQTNQETVLFDPSCLYGDPDFDMVLTTSEPGFDEDFFKSYRKIIPVSTNHQRKMAAYKIFYYVIMWCHEDKKEFRDETLEAIAHLKDLLLSKTS